MGISKSQQSFESSLIDLVQSLLYVVIAAEVIVFAAVATENLWPGVFPQSAIAAPTAAISAPLMNVSSAP